MNRSYLSEILTKRVGNALLMVFVFLLATGCASRKKVVYLQNVENQYVTTLETVPDVRFQANDQIQILVAAENPEVAAPFNLYSSSSSLTQTAPGQGSTPQSYIIAKDGTINFPGLGIITVAGLTREELQDEIARNLRETAKLNDAIVIVRFANLSVTILGEVNSPGVYNFDSDRFTLLEALAMAGDLSIMGRRDNVMIIREKDGKRHIVRHDLTNTRIFSAEEFYLRQNDVVYVEPNSSKIKQQSTTASQMQNITFWMSMITFLTTIGLTIFSVNK